MSFSLLIGCSVVAGLVVGSFLVVVVDRVAQGGSVVATPIRRAPIGIEPIVIDVSTAALFVLMAIRFDDQRAALPAYWILMAVLVAQTWIDLHTRRLPREITYTGIVLGTITLSIAALILDEPGRIWMAGLGAVVALAVMWLIHHFSNGGMGDGDVRLAPLLGLYLGWLNPGIVLPGLFFGFVAGAIVGAVLMAGDRAGRRTALPFGPFLAVGTVVAIFVGQDFLDVVLAR